LRYGVAAEKAQARHFSVYCFFQVFHRGEGDFLFEEGMVVPVLAEEAGKVATPVEHRQILPSRSLLGAHEGSHAV
jgi:hypothetical protein